MKEIQHLPVMREEVKEFLALEGGEVVVDGTLGLGGHASDVLETLRRAEKKVGSGAGVLIGFDQDERNLKVAKKRMIERFGDLEIKQKTRFVHDNFCHLKIRITEEGFPKVDRILLDLGLSSPHVDEAERGFSFMQNGPLDMRFDQRSSLTASEVVNTYSEQDLTDIFYRYGEERLAKKISRLIVERRKEQEFCTTEELRDFLEDVYPKSRGKFGKKSHPATKIFQALRIEVNNELNVLEEVLEQAADVLKTGGRIVVISYHSLEDRIVKQFFKKLERPEVTDPEKKIYQNFEDPIFSSLTKKPVIPDQKEIDENPRSRSAKLRAYEKVREL